MASHCASLHAAQQLVFVDSCRGHQKIKPAKLAQAGLHQGSRISRLAYAVALRAHLLAAGVQAAGQGADRRLVDVSHHHAGATGSEIACGRPANAATGTRYEQHPVFEIKHTQPRLGLPASLGRSFTAQTRLLSLA